MDEKKPKNRESKARRPSLSEVMDRLPPQDIPAEMALLGALLTEPDMMGEVVRFVSGAEPFSSTANGAIFLAIQQSWDKLQAVDLVLLMDRLRSSGELDAVGGPGYLLQLVDSCPSTQAAPHYARIVAEKHRIRRLIQASEQIIWESYQTPGGEVDQARELLDSAEAQIFAIAEGTLGGDPELLAELLQTEYERLCRAAAGEIVRGLASGYHDLDKMTTGFHPGELIVIAGRPSMGKTSLALNLAEQIALGGRSAQQASSIDLTPVPVAFFSLEMSKEAVAQRLISAAANIDLQRIRIGDIHQADLTRVREACDLLHTAPIYVDDSAALTVLQLRAQARRMVRKHGIKCIMIDYLQLLTSPKAARESRQVEVSEISRCIKGLARELRVPVICLAQLNRGAADREGNRPRMSDLRESGSIEQDADAVMLLHREEYYHIGEPDWMDAHPEAKGKAELILAKQRNGPTGVVEFAWDAAATRFKNFAEYGADSSVDVGAYEKQMRAPASLERPRGGGGAGGGAPSLTPTRVEPKGFAPGAKSGPVENFRDGGGRDGGSMAEVEGGEEDPPF